MTEKETVKSVSIRDFERVRTYVVLHPPAPWGEEGGGGRGRGEEEGGGGCEEGFLLCQMAGRQAAGSGRPHGQQLL